MGRRKVLALLVATPYRVGDTLWLITYSSKTIAMNQDSRNQNHFRPLKAQDLLGKCSFGAGSGV